MSNLGGDIPAGLATEEGIGGVEFGEKLGFGDEKGLVFGNWM